jgi:hypothetical protein
VGDIHQAIFFNDGGWLPSAGILKVDAVLLEESLLSNGGSDAKDILARWDKVDIVSVQDIDARILIKCGLSESLVTESNLTDVVTRTV